MNTVISVFRPRRLGHTIINSQKRLGLLYFCHQAHGDQKRKYTNDPYIIHPFTVANTCAWLHDLAWEIGILHDVKEDTEETYNSIFEELLLLDYSYSEATFIVKHVYELTDMFTKEAFPELNRKKRKYLESTRVAEISPLSQSIKYCDLLDNTSSIIENDKDFAKVYLEEKELVLSLMNKGDQVLYNLTLKSLEDAKSKLYGEVR